jgi:hypothetical protein
MRWRHHIAPATTPFTGPWRSHRSGGRHGGHGTFGTSASTSEIRSSCRTIRCLTQTGGLAHVRWSTSQCTDGLILRQCLSMTDRLVGEDLAKTLSETTLPILGRRAILFHIPCPTMSSSPIATLAFWILITSLASDSALSSRSSGMRPDHRLSARTLTSSISWHPEAKQRLTILDILVPTGRSLQAFRMVIRHSRPQGT